MRRRTLKAPAPPLSGLGLFSGAPSTVVVHGAPPGRGILFNATTPAAVALAIDSWRPPNWPANVPTRNTVLSPHSPIATVEHLLSALAGLGVTDALIQVDGPELPIFDGSSTPFVEILQPLLADLPATIDPITPSVPIEVSDASGAYIRAVPRSTPGVSMQYRLDYGPSAPFPPQTATWNGDTHAYALFIAPARTFSLLAEAKQFQAMGLFPHLSPRDMLVINPDGSALDNQLRFPDEPARHKLLDLIGDLALLERPIQADITASRSGHRLTHEFCKRVLQISPAANPA